MQMSGSHSGFLRIFGYDAWHLYILLNESEGEGGGECACKFSGISSHKDTNSFVSGLYPRTSFSVIS